VAAPDYEAKWRERWEAEGVGRIADAVAAGDVFYNQVEFPYPSASGLHVGHVFRYLGDDAYDRYPRMRGKGVFQPMGFDAFGIHTENFSLRTGLHPRDLTGRTVENFRAQLGRGGMAWDLAGHRRHVVAALNAAEGEDASSIRSWTSTTFASNTSTERPGGRPPASRFEATASTPPDGVDSNQLPVDREEHAVLPASFAEEELPDLIIQPVGFRSNLTPLGICHERMNLLVQSVSPSLGDFPRGLPS
jgi:tRNA synthetases class I (M)